MHNHFELHKSLKTSIDSFPETVYVAYVSNLKCAKITYENYGLGLGVFANQKDSEKWFGITKEKQKVNLVKMTTEQAIKVAQVERLRYIHLLSDDVNFPLSHLKIK